MFGNVQVSSQLLRQLFAREIPVCWFSYGGWFTGMAEGLPSKHVDLRRRQTAISSQGGLAIARGPVGGKIRNCRTLLRRKRSGHRGRGSLIPSTAVRAGCGRGDGCNPARNRGCRHPALLLQMADDGAGRPALPGKPFSFEGRQRRPPPDPVNCLLSYCYSLLAKDLTVTAYAVGFDPYIGFYHRPRFGRPALALDLAEEFRPLVAESVVLTLLNNGEIRPNHFVVRAGGVP